MSRVLNRSRPRPSTPKRTSSGAGLHLRQHIPELLRPVRVPRHEPRQVLPGERAVLPRQRVQRHRRVSRDLLPVPPRDAVMLAHTAPRPRPARPCAHRLAPPCAAAQAGCPARRSSGGQSVRHAPARQGAGSQAQPTARASRPTTPGHSKPAPSGRTALPRPAPLHPPHGQHDMRVRLRLAVRPYAPMHVQVRHHATVHELLAHEVTRQCHRLRTWTAPAAS